MSGSQIDKKYLSLQFLKRIYEKNGTEFQSLFSDIMQKAYPDFQKIKPYGNLGDGGNDGYIPASGTYYQVYSPENPSEKSSAAAKKMIADFNKLKSRGWDNISKIKEYYIVFNDKNNGSDLVLESAQAQLSKDNPDISFHIFLPNKLEKIFLGLTHEELISLGFDVDQRNAIKISVDIIKRLESELDKGYASFVSKSLEKIQAIIISQGDDSLLLEFEILQTRTLQRLEKFNIAQEKYESLYKRYPKDVRAPLYLAEMYLNAENYEQNRILLDEIKKIDNSHWLYNLETLIRKAHGREHINIKDIDTDSFSNDYNIKSDYYRIYGILLQNSGDYENAQTFIERALYFNPDKIKNYDAKISLSINSLNLEPNENKKISRINETLKFIEMTREKFTSVGDINVRDKVYLDYKQSMLLIESERINQFDSLAKEIFEQIFLCYFDTNIDNILSYLNGIVSFPKNEFETFITYLKSAQKPISHNLAKGVFLQFIDQGTLETDGINFFTNQYLPFFTELINDYKTKNYDAFILKIKDDTQFAALLATAFKVPDLSKKIIESLPNNRSIQKDKLRLILEEESGNLDAAFELLKTMDLAKMGYLESHKFFTVAKKKKAWDFILTFGEKLLNYENEEDKVLRVKLELFNANFMLDRFQQTAKIGEEILANEVYLSLLNDKNKLILLCQTITALLRRNNNKDNIRAKWLVETYNGYLFDFESNALLASEVYLRNNDALTAIGCVVKGVKLAKRLSPEEYASLFGPYLGIEKLLGWELLPEEEIKKECFVKFKEEERWYFVGESDTLDAQSVPEEKQNNYLGKKNGDKVTFSNDYAFSKKEKTIENILPIEKYIWWQTTYHFYKLSDDGMWDKAVSVEIPHTEDGQLDLSKMIALLEAQNKPGEEFFNIYCNDNLPLAALATNEGGLIEAISRILSEQRGFIKISDGSQAEFYSQKNLVNRIIDNKNPFYLDGIAAFFLAETGMLIKISQFIPNLKVPQSVIGLLLEVKDKASSTPGQVGKIHYFKGKIGFSEVNHKQIQLINNNVTETIEFLEEKPNNITAISSATKSSTFSEQQIPPSLCDAIILAQRENIPVLTDDYLYLHFNEFETKKSKPEYFSSIALIRVLNERGHINFQEYLDFFSYLASYRVRFLHVATEDLKKAIFGDDLKSVPQINNLKKLNLPLTFSEEYGVEPISGLKLILTFTLELLINNSISSSNLTEIFSEIMSTYPINKDKVVISRTLVFGLIKAIKQNPSISIGLHTLEKIDALFGVCEQLNSPISH